MTKRIIAMFALVGALAFGVAACGDDESTSESSSSSTSEQKPVAEIANLTGVDTAVTLDAGFVEALGALKLTPGVVGDATLSKDGVVAFPITGGNATYYDPAEELRPYVQGAVLLEGSGLSLTAGDTEVELTDFVIDPGTSELTGTVSVNGKVAADSALLFDLDGSTLEPLATEGDNAVLEGTTVLLSSDAAALLNDTFKTDALEGGFPIGISKITLAG
jgi:hypothetical protein